MIDIDQLRADIAMGQPSPRLISITERGGVVSMSIVLSQPVEPDIWADHVIYHGPGLRNPKIEAYVRRFLRLPQLESALVTP